MKIYQMHTYQEMKFISSVMPKIIVRKQLLTHLPKYLTQICSIRDRTDENNISMFKAEKNHLIQEERKQYLEDNDRLKHLHQYYYIHEIIDTYNQNIR